MANKATAVSLPVIEHEVLGTTQEENIRKARELIDNVPDPIALADKELGTDRNDAWFDRVDELQKQFRTEYGKAQKLLKGEGKPAGADRNIARRFVQDSVRAQMDIADINDSVDSDRMIAMLKHINGAKVRFDEEFGNIVFDFPKTAERKSSGGGTGTRRAQLGSVMVKDEEGNPIHHFSGGVAGLETFMTEWGEQAGFNTELGSGTDDSGRPHIYQKGHVRDDAPKPGTRSEKNSLPTDDGKYQEYLLRYGDCKPYNADYKVASVMLEPGHTVEYSDKEGNVVAYHRKDEDGKTWCSPTGNASDEVSRKFEHDGATYNG